MRRLSYWTVPLYNAEAPSGEVAVNGLGHAFDRWLERKLHEMFDSVTLEPVPADLLSLVNQIDQKEPTSGNEK